MPSFESSPSQQKSHDMPPSNRKGQPTTFRSQLCRAPLKYTGFASPLTFLLFLSTVGVFAIFCTFNLFSSLPDGHPIKPNPPGPLYWFHRGVLKVAMQVHLWSVLPAGILLPLQFLPIMRRKYMRLHIFSGRLLLILLIIGNITALKMGSRSFGGSIETRVWIVFVASLSSFSLFKAWVSARSLNIDDHRAWIFRTWGVAGSIFTLRIFMTLIAFSIHKFTSNIYTGITTCDELIFMYRSVRNSTSVASLYERFPGCMGQELEGRKVMVHVNLSKWYPEERAAMMNMVFGVSGWCALVANAVAVEWYLNSTRKGNERLRKASVVRKREKGLEPRLKSENSGRGET
ncbi:hypothetical protein B0O99DRAFT_619887 [Bisporella sp. PMI_857]|nr:hypothetical protein B0O99DRAFT_619887 [Bisporella sp. PMI_857]